MNKKPHKTTAPKSAEQDIIQLILDDHKPLKKIIKILKDSDRELTERQKQFEQFGSLLTKHAKSEEQVLYVYMKEDEALREESFEGDVEHALAEQVLENAERTSDEDLWSARVKVLAELVEHHIEEEEEELLPHFKKHSTKEDRIELGEQYLRVKKNIELER